MSTEYNTKAVKAFAMWREVFLKKEPLMANLRPAEAMARFAAFLGDPYDGARDYIVNTRNPEVQRLLDLITGLNGTAIIHMMIIQKESQHD